MKETMESVFNGLPNGCVLKNPNSWNNQYQATYKEHSKNSVVVKADTAREAVVKLAEELALREGL